MNKFIKYKLERNEINLPSIINISLIFIRSLKLKLLDELTEMYPRSSSCLQYNQPSIPKYSKCPLTFPTRLYEDISSQDLIDPSSQRNRLSGLPRQCSNIVTFPRANFPLCCSSSRPRFSPLFRHPTKSFFSSSLSFSLPLLRSFLMAIFYSPSNRKSHLLANCRWSLLASSC